MTKDGQRVAAGAAGLADQELQALFERAGSDLPRFKGNPDLELEKNRAFAKDAMRVRKMPFVAEGKKYALRVPEPEMLLGRLREDRPYAYARLPHGFWDCLWQLDTARAAIAADPGTRDAPREQRDALAARLCAKRYPATAAAFAPHFLDEVLADIPVHAREPDFLRAVAFSGYPTYREKAIGNHSARGRALTALVAAHFAPEEPLYDAMLWKRMLISGHLKELPALCRERPVVLVTSRYFADLPNRWRLERFHHVVIPPSDSHWERHEILERTKAALSRFTAPGTPSPIVLTQCGGSLAFWLITRLYAGLPRAFYLDLGQALDGWFFDNAEIRVYRWMKVYTRSVIANCELEPYYRRLKGSSYDEWFSSLP